MSRIMLHTSSPGISTSQVFTVQHLAMSQTQILIEQYIDYIFPVHDDVVVARIFS